VNSLATEAGFGGFLARSLDVLERERPDAHAELCRVAAPRTVALVVEGEAVWLAFHRTGLRIEAARHPADVELETSESAILDVIDRGATLVSLALSGRLELRGSVDDVLGFHDALSLYVHGAVRAPSFPGLLREYRGAVANRASGVLREEVASMKGVTQ
jgi:hypothetical protein